MSATLTKKLNELHEAVKQLTGGHTEAIKAWEEKFDTIDARFLSLEGNISKNILDKYGNRPVPKSDWSWARFAYAVAYKDWSFAKFEHQEVKKYKEKVLEAGDFGGGGSLIPPQYIAELIEFLRPELITAQLGVRMLTGLQGSPVIFPKLTAGATYYWVAPESTSITASEQTTGSLNLQPHKVAALTKLSRELTILSNPAMETIVRADIVRALQEGIDETFFKGTGNAGQPTGLLNWSPAISNAAGTWSGDGTDDHLDLNILKDLRKQLGLSNALRGRLAWAVNVDSWESIDRLFDANNRPYLQVDPAVGTRGTLLGFPIHQSTLVSPSGTDDIFLGNWEDAMIGMWNTISVESSTETSTAFEKDQLWIKATALVDFGIRRNVSFCKQTLVNVA